MSGDIVIFLGDWHLSESEAVAASSRRERSSQSQPTSRRRYGRKSTATATPNSDLIRPSEALDLRLRAKNPVIAGIATRKDPKAAAWQGICVAFTWLAPGPAMAPAAPAAPAAKAASSVPGCVAWRPRSQRRKARPGRATVPVCPVAIATMPGHPQLRAGAGQRWVT
jgi:hypothetical protein